MTPEQIARLPYRPCVGIMLANADGRIFTGQRIDMPGPAWQMPQGGIDDGETARDAALRELWEETGIPAHLAEIVAQTSTPIHYDLPHDLVPKIWKGRYRGQEQTWFLFRFLGQDSDVNIDTDHAEFARWKWSEVDRLADEIVPFKRDVYTQVVKELAPFIA
ncbi:MAG: RNA pyrophosphohydrolase [Deltaproteobacteria bacterium]